MFYTKRSISIRSNNTFHWGINDNITIILTFSPTFFSDFTRTITTIWNRF